MSMHVSQGKDYFGTSNEEGFWRSRTGLEQKLIIVSSILLCLCFALMITTIVLDKKLENYKSTSSSKDKTTTTPDVYDTTSEFTSLSTNEISAETDSTGTPSSTLPSSPELSTETKINTLGNTTENNTTENNTTLSDEKNSTISTPSSPKL